MYSDIDIISSMCMLMVRGALVSMCSVIFFLPALLMLCDGLIRRTSFDMKNERDDSKIAAVQSQLVEG